MKKNKLTAAMLIVGAAATFVVVFALATHGEEPSELSEYGLSTDTSKRLIEVEQLVPGGVNKGDISAITPRVLESVSTSSIPGQTRGILLEIEGEQRFYPENIMVRHEVANDTVGGVPVAVTFSPLTGSSVVYDRRSGDQVLEFGVSGQLYESNTLLFDVETESLWSQATGAAVMGELTGAQLTALPMQSLTLDEVRALFPEARVLSEKTGFKWDYRQHPYPEYLQTDELVTDVTRQDPRYPNKAMMLVVDIEGGPAVAIPRAELPEGEFETEIAGRQMKLVVQGPLVNMSVDGEAVPAHTEYWFSFIAQRGDNFEVWTP